jgi:hypothetical protein
MYKPSNSPVFPDRAANLARKFAASDARIEAAKQASVNGRARIFNLLTSPSQVADVMGTAAGVNVANWQAQADPSRVSGVLGVGLLDSEFTGQAPECVPMRENIQVACAPSRSTVAVSSGPLADARPGMPHRAPHIVRGPNGPLHFRGESPTFPHAHLRQGLTGIAPAWNDAGVMPEGQQPNAYDVGVGGWLMAHPFLTLALAGAGVYALSRRAK